MSCSMYLYQLLNLVMQYCDCEASNFGSVLQVDNGCIKHLIPSLREGNWDVLIAHFLGVVCDPFFYNVILL